MSNGLPQPSFVQSSTEIRPTKLVTTLGDQGFRAPRRIHSLRSHPNNQHLWLKLDDGSLLQLSRTSDVPLQKIASSPGPWQLSRNGEYLCTTITPTTVALFATSSGKLLRQYHTQRPVTSVAISEQGHWIVTATLDLTVELWESFTGNHLHAWIGQGPLAISSDARTIAYQGAVTGICAYLLAQYTIISRIIELSPKEQPTALELSDNGENLWAGFGDGSVAHWTLFDRADDYTFHWHTRIHNKFPNRAKLQTVQTPDFVHSPTKQLSPEGIYLLARDLEENITCVCRNGDVCLLKATTGDVIQQTHVSFFTMDALSTELIGVHSQSIYRQSLRSLQPVRWIDDDSCIVTVGTTSVDNKWVLIGTETGRLVLYRTETQEQHTVMEGYHCAVRSIAIFPDATRAVVLYTDGSVAVFDVVTGDLIVIDHRNQTPSEQPHRPQGGVIICPDTEQIITWLGGDGMVSVMTCWKPDLSGVVWYHKDRWIAATIVKTENRSHSKVRARTEFRVIEIDCLSGEVTFSLEASFSGLAFFHSNGVSRIELPQTRSTSGGRFLYRRTHTSSMQDLQSITVPVTQTLCISHNGRWMIAVGLLGSLYVINTEQATVLDEIAMERLQTEPRCAWFSSDDLHFWVGTARGNVLCFSLSERQS